MAQFLEKKLLNIKCTFWFPTNFVWNISHSKKNWARHYHKCTYTFTQSTCYSCQTLMKLQFSWQSYKKYSDIKFHENPFSGSRDVPFGQTDLMKLIIAFCNFVNNYYKEAVTVTYLLGCDAKQSGWCTSTFQRKLLPPCSTLNGMTSQHTVTFTKWRYLFCQAMCPECCISNYTQWIKSK